MLYDEQNDLYICRNEKKIRDVCEGTRKSKLGFESTVAYYECEDCGDFPHKKKCTRAKGTRKMQISQKIIRQRQESLPSITTAQGTVLRANRFIQSEGTFGVVKQDYRFVRFLHRGNPKIFMGILFVAIGCNVNKYYNKIQQNRTGSQLHQNFLD